jgi:hypothetical protein
MAGDTGRAILNRKTGEGKGKTQAERKEKQYLH